MAEDREILREIWNGRVPVAFSLASEDCSTLSTPDPHYVLVPRMSYFPIIFDKIRKYFIRSVNSELHNEEIWLDFNGIPLKWNCPVGVLFDILNGGTNLPWCLTAHFSNYPEKFIIRCPNRDVMESYFLASVKEADAFKHRGLVVKNMQIQDHKQLWNGLCNDRFDQFWTVNKKLMDYCGEEGFRHIPFCIYVKGEAPVQKLQKPYGEDGSTITLEDLLNNALSSYSWKGDRVVIQGIEPPLETPIQWLSEHMSHPDNFLHICIVSDE